jgi:hypothetical protein
VSLPSSKAKSIKIGASGIGVQNLRLRSQTVPESNNPDKDKFLYPRSNYRGEFTPGNLVFNANLQEFSQRVEYLCALETNGKISPEVAYQEIRKLYKQLKQSKKELGIGEEPPSDASGTSE